MEDIEMNNFFAKAALEILSSTNTIGTTWNSNEAGVLMHLVCDAVTDAKGRGNGRSGALLNLALDLLNATEANDAAETLACAEDLRSYCYDLLAANLNTGRKRGAKGLAKAA